MAGRAGLYHKGIGGDTHHKGMGQAGNKSVLSYRADIGVPGEMAAHTRTHARARSLRREQFFPRFTFISILTIQFSRGRGSVGERGKALARAPSSPLFFFDVGEKVARRGVHSLPFRPGFGSSNSSLRPPRARSSICLPVDFQARNPRLKNPLLSTKSPLSHTTTAATCPLTKTKRGEQAIRATFLRLLPS